MPERLVFPVVLVSRVLALTHTHTLSLSLNAVFVLLLSLPALDSFSYLNALNLRTVLRPTAIHFSEFGLSVLAFRIPPLLAFPTILNHAAKEDLILSIRA